MKNFKKILALAAVVVVTAAIAIVGTLAYLTDRDSKVNTFVVGDVAIELTEEFEQGTTLTPGVNIEKKPVITNTGKNDAWVWLTFSIPSALDNFVEGTEVGSNENVIHWNPLGATTEGYVTEARVDKAVNDGNLPAGTTAADILANNKTWNVFNSLGEGKNAYQEEINGVKYNTYVLLYNKALTKGETTLTGIYNVFLDATVDIAPNGDWYKVSGGVAKKLDWNTNEDGAPAIYVAAYAAQAEGFADAQAAYKAYQTQWGDNGAAETPAVAANADELSKALAAATDSIILLTADVAADTHTVNENTTANIELQGNTLSGIVENNGEMNIASGKMEASYIENFGEATFTNIDMKAGTPADYASIGKANSVTEYNDVNINSAGGGVAAADGAKVIFNSGSVDVSTTNTSGRYNFYAEGAGSEIVINGGTFSFSKTLNQKRAYIYAGAGTTVTINGGEFGPASTRSGYTAGILGSGTIVIKGGTFGFNPSAWIADGYEAVKNGSTWTVSAK